MNILSKAIDEIKYTIPQPILIEAFKDQANTWRQAPISVDEKIMSKVIRPRVLIDCNLVGGQIKNVSLQGLNATYFENYNVVYNIPKDRTGGLSIVSVLDVGYLPIANIYAGDSMGYVGINPMSMNNVSNAAARVADSHSAIPPVSTADVDLIGENTILIKNMQHVTGAYFLRCMLTNDPNLSNISPRSYLAFSKLCEFAVKSYIYNTLIIRIDRAYIEGGQELGAFKNIVENYSDAEEMYRTHLREVWQATAFMNDTFNNTRLLQMMISPGI